MVRALILLFLVIGLPLAAQADEQAQRQRMQDEQAGLLAVLSIYRDLSDMCRGPGGEDPRARRACDIREKVGRVLNSMGWCYGNQNQNAADLQWHKCTNHELF